MFATYVSFMITVFLVSALFWGLLKSLNYDGDYTDYIKWSARAFVLAPVWPILLVFLVIPFLKLIIKSTGWFSDVV